MVSIIGTEIVPVGDFRDFLLQQVPWTSRHSFATVVPYRRRSAVIGEVGEEGGLAFWRLRTNRGDLIRDQDVSNLKDMSWPLTLS